MIKKILASTLVVLLLLASNVKAADIQTYELTTGVNPDNTLITKTVTGYKHGDVIIETDALGNPIKITDENGVKHSRGYILKGVVGQIKTEEPVWVDEGYNFDKVHEIKRLQVDFWLPNVITGEGVNTDYSSRNISEFASVNNYKFNSGGQLVFVPEENEDTWKLLALATNPNKYDVKATITFYPGSLTKQVIIPLNSTIYIDMGSIKNLIEPEGILYSQGLNFTGMSYNPPVFQYMGTIQLNKILYSKYPASLEKNGGFIPAGRRNSSSTPVPVFTENGGMKLAYEFEVAQTATKLPDGSWNKLRRQAKGTAIYNNTWVVTTDNDEVTPIITELFNKWEFDVPRVLGMYGNRDVFLQSSDSTVGATFDLLWPFPIGVMGLQPGQIQLPNWGGWYKADERTANYLTRTSHGGLITDQIYVGAIITEKALPKYGDLNKTFIRCNNSYEYCVNNDTYRMTNQRQVGYTYQPNGWMEFIPVIQTFPCFVTKHEIVPISNKDAVGINVNSELGWVVRNGYIKRPVLNWESKLKTIKVTVNQGANQNIYTWTPQTGSWQQTQNETNEIKNYLPQDWTIKIIYDNKIVSQVPEEGFTLSDNNNIELAQTHLTNQNISLDPNYKSIVEKLKQPIKYFYPMQQITINADPILLLNNNCIKLKDNNVLAQEEKILTLTTTFNNCLNRELILNQLALVCQDTLGNYCKEAAIVNGNIELPPNNLAKFDNIYSMNKDTVYSRQDGTFIKAGLQKTTPFIYGTSYLSQPLIIKDFKSLQLDSIASYRTIPASCYRIYDRNTGTVTPIDYF